MMLFTANARLRRARKASDEIHKYTADITELTKLRDKAIQNSRLYTKNTADIFEAEVVRYNTQIEMAQKVQMFLMDNITEDY